MVVVKICSAGVGSMVLEVEDESTLQNFLIYDGSSNAREYLLQLLDSGYLERRPDWDAARIRREIEIKIPYLNIEYVLPQEEQPIDATKQKEQKQKKGSLKWSHRATMRLIFHWKERRARFENNIEKNEAIWEEVAEAMVSEGFEEVNSSQCENRFKYLKRIYMETKDINRKSTGQPEKSCAYYDEMNDIFKKTPQISPPSLCSSRDGSSVSYRSPEPTIISNPLSNNDIDPDTNTNRTTNNTPTDPPTAPPPAKKTRLESSLTKWADAFQQRLDATEAARQKRHEENIEMQKQTNELYKQMMSKLLEKL